MVTAISPASSSARGNSWRKVAAVASMQANRTEAKAAVLGMATGDPVAAAAGVAGVVAAIAGVRGAAAVDLHCNQRTDE